MIKELRPSRAAKMPLENSSPLERCFRLRMCRSDRRGISPSTTFAAVLVGGIGEPKGVRGKNPNGGGIVEVGDGIV